MLDFLMTGATILPYIALIGMVIKHKMDIDYLEEKIETNKHNYITVYTRLQLLEHRVDDGILKISNEIKITTNFIKKIVDNLEKMEEKNEKQD